MAVHKGKKRDRAKRLPKEIRRKLLLDAGATVLLGEGFDGLTMEAVVREAGVSRGLGYVYFPNVEALALALFDREVEEVFQRLVVAANLETTDAIVAAGMRVYLDYVAERGPLIALLRAGLGERASATSLREREDQMTTLWAAALQRDSNLTESASGVLAKALYAAANAFAQALHRDEISREEVEVLADAFMMGAVNQVSAISVVATPSS